MVWPGGAEAGSAEAGAPKAVSPNAVNESRDVVLVHGLFYGAWSTGVLAWRLRRRGWRIHHFACSPVSAGRDGGAQALAQFLRDKVREEELASPHVVGHSFGGLVILKAFDDDPDLPSGRIVLLGSPLQGSRAAKQVMRWLPGRKFLGAAGPPLIEGFTRVPSGRETGLVAGSRRIGLGVLTGARLGPSDGTIGLDEADAEGLKDRVVLPVTHTGLLLTSLVADRVDRFLRKGDFGPASGAAE